MNSIIETKDLKLWYGDHQVLKGITMDIPEHQITALIGPSGCGKSTFLKTLNRMNDLVENVRITGEGGYFLQLSGCILRCSESISCRKCSKVPEKCSM